MMRFEGAQAGVLRLGDVPRQQRNVGEEVLVFVVTSLGTEFECIVSFTEKWQATGWTPMFACPNCAAPARVLGVDEAGILACGRCVPRRTLSQRQRGTTWWHQHDGELVDRLVRLARTRCEDKNGELRGLAERLARGSSARAAPVIELAHAAITVADAEVPGGGR